MTDLGLPAFDNSFVRDLPADPRSDRAPRRIRGVCYSRTAPTPVAAPRMLAWSADVAEMLGLGAAPLDEARAAAWARVLGGNHLDPGMAPIATRYGGHQFGNWAGQLGDGRAISLGEVLTPRHGRQELQLKGAGRTPYSRSGDGRAVLRSSLREHVCSEAIHHLGIPTTRSLGLVATGEGVERDMFYDGRPRIEPGAVVCRVAPTFLRFGHFEILAADGDVELLGKLFEYTVRHHFPGFAADARDAESVYALFDEVAARTVRLVADWQRVGFVHGVMNTDNMSIVGLTIDYGPYGILEPYEPTWTPNTTDAEGRRYCFANQPRIALYNLVKLAEALSPLPARATSEARAQERLEASVERAANAMADALGATYAKKLGLGPDPADEALVEAGLRLMFQGQADYTRFFRALGDVAALPRSAGDAEVSEALAGAWYKEGEEQSPEVLGWVASLRRRWDDEPLDGEARRAAMNLVNPIYVPRNWLAQEAIDAATEGDLAPLHALVEVLRAPYTAQPGRDHFAGKRPDWAKHKAGCSMLSCSS